MKQLATYLLAAMCLTGIADAAITPVITPGSPTPDGSNFLWSYSISVDNQEQLVAGDFTTCADGTPCGTFFTVYDFVGYVPGSIMAPTGWTASAQLTGVTATNQSPADNPNVTNLSFIYTGPPATLPGPIPELSGFTADSTFGDVNPNGVFTYQAQKIDNTTAPDSGTGPIRVPLAPSGVPEPGSLALIGSGLVGLGFLRRALTRS